jgi:hypothetical protein
MMAALGDRKPCRENCGSDAILQELPPRTATLVGEGGTTIEQQVCVGWVCEHGHQEVLPVETGRLLQQAARLQAAADVATEQRHRAVEAMSHCDTATTRSGLSDALSEELKAHSLAIDKRDEADTV